MTSETLQGLALRYGINPHQAPARAFRQDGPLPFRVVNGSPGYVNLLDGETCVRLRDVRMAVEAAQAARTRPAALRL